MIEVNLLTVRLIIGSSLKSVGFFCVLPIFYNMYMFNMLVGSTCFLSGYLSVKDIKNVDS